MVENILNIGFHLHCHIKPRRHEIFRLVASDGQYMKNIEYFIAGGNIIRAERVKVGGGP